MSLFIGDRKETWLVFWSGKKVKFIVKIEGNIVYVARDLVHLFSSEDEEAVRSIMEHLLQFVPTGQKRYLSSFAEGIGYYIPEEHCENRNQVYDLIARAANL